jgi:hypothetical protein
MKIRAMVSSGLLRRVTILHSHRRENLKSYIFLEHSTFNTRKELGKVANCENLIQLDTVHNSSFLWSRTLFR